MTVRVVRKPSLPRQLALVWRQQARQAAAKPDGTPATAPRPRREHGDFAAITAWRTHRSMPSTPPPCASRQSAKFTGSGQRSYARPALAAPGRCLTLPQPSRASCFLSSRRRARVGPGPQSGQPPGPGHACGRTCRPDQISRCRWSLRPLTPPPFLPRPPAPPASRRRSCAGRTPRSRRVDRSETGLGSSRIVRSLTAQLVLCQSPTRRLWRPAAPAPARPTADLAEAPGRHDRTKRIDTVAVPWRQSRRAP